VVVVVVNIIIFESHFLKGKRIIRLDQTFGKVFFFLSGVWQKAEAAMANDTHTPHPPTPCILLFVFCPFCFLNKKETV